MSELASGIQENAPPENVAPREQYKKVEHVSIAKNTGEKKLINGPYTYYPDWSPDGTAFAFHDSNDISIADSSGNILRKFYLPGLSWEPDWSIDEKKILFKTNRHRDKNYEIYVMSSDGSSQVRLTNDNCHNSHPKWSSDGSKIAYSAKGDLWAMNPDGSDKRKLTDTSWREGSPCWSPDGRWIAYHSNEKGNPDIWIINIATGAKIQLTDDPALDSEPTWHPSGKYIAFKSERTGNFELWIMTSDGKFETQLTDSDYWERDPDWHPSGNKLLFSRMEGRYRGKHTIWVVKVEFAAPENIQPENFPPENVAFENILPKKIGKPSVEELKERIRELEDKLSKMKELEEKFENFTRRIEELKAQLAEQEQLERRIRELENKLLRMGWLENRAQELENAVREGRVGASVSVGEEGTVSIRTFSPTIEIASRFSKGKISIKVSSTVREGRTILIDVNNSILPVTDLGDLQVFYDNEPIPMADNYSDVLDPFDDNSPEYLAVLGREGVQVLVSVPKFSTHEILITREKVGRRISPLTAIFGAAVVASIAAAISLYRRKHAAS